MTRSYRRASTGSGSKGEPPPVSATHQIAYGEVQRGAMRGETCNDWTFVGAAGDIVQLNMRSADFDTYLYLFAPDGGILAENDDSNFSLNSQINATLTESGLYTLSACTLPGTTATGVYRLILAQANPDTFIQQSSPEVRSSTLVTNTYDIWQFDAMGGEVVSIAMNSDVFDSYLELYDPNEQLIMSSDDTDESYNARISDFVLPMTGTYTVRLMAFGDGSGDYSALMQFGVASSDGAATSGGSSGGNYRISYGQRLTGTLDGSGGHRWAFSGDAGDTVVIGVYSDEFDTFVELHDASLTMLVSDDDGGNNTNSFLTYTLPTSGEYGIVVHGYGAGAVGTYTLELKAR